MSDSPRKLSNSLRTLVSFNSDDLTNPSEKQKYPLGLVISLDDAEPNPLNTASSVSNVETKYIYIFNKFGIGKFRPALIEHSLLNGEEYFLEVVTVTITTASLLCAIPQISIPTGQYGFCLLEGYGKSHVRADIVSITKGDYLLLDKQVPDGNKLQKQTVNPTRVDVNTRAVANETQSGAGAFDKIISIYLIGRQGGVRI